MITEVIAAKSLTQIFYSRSGSDWGVATADVIETEVSFYPLVYWLRRGWVVGDHLVGSEWNVDRVYFPAAEAALASWPRAGG